MENKNPARPPASAQEVARKIAALHNSTPAKISAVKMIGTEEVRKFVTRLRAAHRDSGNTVLALD
jgi:hypothetical protein